MKHLDHSDVKMARFCSFALSSLLWGRAHVKIRCGIPPIPPGIPGSSQVGSRLFLAGSQVGSRPGLWNVPGGIPPLIPGEIPPIPPGILGGIPPILPWIPGGMPPIPPGEPVGIPPLIPGGIKEALPTWDYIAAFHLESQVG